MALKVTDYLLGPPRVSDAHVATLLGKLDGPDAKDQQFIMLLRHYCEKAGVDDANALSQLERNPLPEVTVVARSAQAMAPMLAIRAATTPTGIPLDRPAIATQVSSIGVAFQVQPRMLRLRHHLEIVRGVVRSIAVTMVDDLIRLEQATQHLFHDDAVLCNKSLLTCKRMIRGKDVHVAARLEVATDRVGIALASITDAEATARAKATRFLTTWARQIHHAAYGAWLGESGRLLVHRLVLSTGAALPVVAATREFSMPQLYPIPLEVSLCCA